MSSQGPGTGDGAAPVIADTLQNAMALHQSGDLTGAERGYRAILRTRPDDEGALLYFGIVEAQRRNFSGALSLLERLLEINPRSADALISHGNVLTALGRPDEALASFDRALAIDGASAQAQFSRGNALRELNRLEDALSCYDKCLHSVPAAPEVLFNRGVILQLLGRHEQALASYDAALALDPDDADSLNNRGNALFDLHRFDHALASYEGALALRPDFAEALNNRGNTLRELGRPDEGLASCKQALALRPDFAEAHNNLGNIQQHLGRMDDAIASFQKALAFEPAFGEAHNNLGNALRKQGRLTEAVASYRRAVELMPTAVDPHINLSAALHQLVPPWHMPMMNDADRNRAYAEALGAAITPETQVLEIGTGSGLLAMLAARLGAHHVATCEAVPLIAAAARDIVAANGWESKVNVIPRSSRDLTVGTDMPRRADLLVSEILSSELLGEGVLSSIEDAKRRLLEPGAKIIPAAGSVVFALVGGDAVMKNMTVGKVMELDLSPFNAIASAKRYIHRHDLEIEFLTDPAEAFTFDFVRCDYFPPERKIMRIPIAAAGNCYGVAQWIRLKLHDTITFENHPAKRTPASSWQTCFYRFPEPVPVRPGQTAKIGAAHNRSAVWFFWEGLDD